MKRDLRFFRWLLCLLLFVGGCTLAYSQTKVTSIDDLGAGSIIKIYPYGKAGDESLALACSGNKKVLTSYADAGAGDMWILVDAGSGYYYLKNRLGCYWAYQNNDTKGLLISTTDIDSAVKVKLTWYYGVCFWNEKDDNKALRKYYGSGYLYYFRSMASDEGANFDVVLYGKYDGRYYFENGVRYKLDEQTKTAKVVSNDYSGDIVIPQTISFWGDVYQVTAIDDKCFENCSSLTGITLPESITSLPDKCFWGCSRLTKVSLPESITSLSNFCFSGCSSLTNITLPKGITSLGQGLIAGGCFQDCSSLTNITLPESITRIGRFSFKGCSSLTNITLPKGITYVADRCFLGCSSLTSITLPEGITTIGEYCFYGCSSLTSITLPSTLRSIGDYALNPVKKIVCQAKTPPSCEVYNIYSNQILYVPKGTVDIYKETSPWNDAGTILDGIPISSLSFPKEFTMERTESKTLDYTVYPKYADQTLSWSSSNAEVASVDEKTGVITANKVGDAVITATVITAGETAMEGISASTTIHVTPLKISSLSVANVTLVRTLSQKLEVAVSPEQADNQRLEWSSDNPAVATVDTTGMVTAMGVGTARITAKTTDGSNISATAKVNVTPLKVQSMSFAKQEVYVKRTKTTKLSLTLNSKDVDDKTMKWTSSNDSVATVSQNTEATYPIEAVVTAHKIGKTTITAEAQDGSGIKATCEVEVTPLTVDSVVLITTSAVKTIPTKLEAKVFPEDADYTKLKWSSWSPEIATVTEDGIITGLKVGTAYIDIDVEVPGYNSIPQPQPSCHIQITALPVETITLPTEISIVKTDSQKLEYTVLPAASDNQKLKWSSNHADIASVNDSTGVITAHKVGDAIITATATDGSGVSASTTVHVTPLKISSLSVAKELTLVHTSNQKLEVAVSPEQADNQKIEWSSDDPDVATVDTLGVVTAMSVGTAHITVKATDGSNISAVTTVHVSPLKISSLSIADELTLVHTSNQKLEVAVSPEQADNQKLEWSSDNPDVATVDTLGVVTAMGIGTANITAKTTDGSNISASTVVHVTPLQVSQIDMTKEITLLRTTTAMIEAIVTPELADNKKLSWMSEDNNIATVTQEGVVKAVNVGTTNITATATDGSGLSATCKVTVTPVTVTLSTNTINLQKGDKYVEQTVTIFPDNYGHKDVVWTASGNGVASVDANGNITAIKPGVDTLRCSLAYDKDIYSECRVIVYDENVVYVGGLYYILDDKDTNDRWATVTSIYGGKNTSLDAKNVAQYYSGTINIPETIIYDGYKYTVKKVGSYAFNCQNELQSIYIPRTVTEVEHHAAIKAEKLNRVNVADESVLVNIGEEAFKWCAGLKRFTFDGTSLQMESIDKAAFRECTALERFTWTGNTSIKTIGNSAFYGCTALEKVLWKGKSELKTIQDYAFFKCSSLNNFDMPNTTLSVGNSSFRYNEGLTDIKLSTSLSYIDKYAFAECGFSHITLPESLKEINDNIIANCSSLTDVYCYATKVPDFIGVEDPSSMNDVFAQTTLHVIYGNEAAYKADSWWGRFYQVVGCGDPSTGEVKVTSITISQENVTLKSDDTIQLEATVYPTNATNKKVLWSSSNDDVAMVTDEGFVLAIAEGEAVVSAKTTDGSNLTINCIVTVTRASGIGYVTVGDVKLVVNKHHLKVVGLADSDVIKVVNAIGFTVYEGTEHEVDLNAAGIYIVKVKGKTLKISIK